MRDALEGLLDTLVSIRASAREATWRKRVDATTPSFNPRLRAGGDATASAPTAWTGSFNPRLRAGGDTPDEWASDRFIEFQSAPPRGRRHGERVRQRSGSGFNPRLRAGGDDVERRVGLHGLVSIRASAREATFVPAKRERLVVVSIRASAREATRGSRRVGARFGVSIRASAREATRVDSFGYLVTMVSIRASAREATSGSSSFNAVTMFQSAPPRGRRRPAPPRAAGARCFNPRLRAGGDRHHPFRRTGGVEVSIRASAREATRGRIRGCRVGCVSIRASAREATAVADRADHVRAVSIRASAREATMVVEHSEPPSTVSIRASAREATGAAAAVAGVYALFQSAPPRGRRLPRRGHSVAEIGVSIRASAREATSRSLDRRTPDRSFNPRLRAGGDNRE